MKARQRTSLDPDPKTLARFKAALAYIEAHVDGWLLGSLFAQNNIRERFQVDDAARDVAARFMPKFRADESDFDALVKGMDPKQAERLSDARHGQMFHAIDAAFLVGLVVGRRCHVQSTPAARKAGAR